MKGEAEIVVKNSLSYRPDIDGLRAIAVTSVVGYHAFPQWVQGGFVGVDIFFVISGFLITSIVLKSSSQNGFSVLDFYSRRIRRIFPALIAMFTVCLLVGWLLLFPDELQLLGKHTLGATFFVSNFVFWSEAGYFDTASELKPLLHLWSLSIEEQFYALWPITLLIFLKSKRPILCTVALTLASFLLCVSGQLDKVANFYMPLTRIWELLCGALLASTLTNNNLALRILPNTKYRAVFAELSSLTGIVMLALSIFFVLNKKTVFPGWASLLPTVGAVFVIAAGPTTLINRYILGNRVFVFIGLISYPFYLWHWPFLSFPKITDGLVLPLDMRIYAVIGAFIFSVLTYLYIEKPLRHRAGNVSAILLAIALLLGITGYLCKTGTIQPKQSSILFQKIATAKKDTPTFYKSYNVSIGNHVYVGTGNGTKTTMLIGDSNMYQYWPGVEALLADKNVGRKALLGGCHIPIPHVGSPDEDIDCNDLNSRAYSIATNNPDIDIVVIAAQWRGAASFQYLDGKRYYPMSTAEGMQKAMDELASTILKITARGKMVYLLLNIPGGPEFEPHNLIQRSLRGFNVVPYLAGGISIEEHKAMTQKISPLLEDVAHRSGAIILDPADFLCSNNWCSAVTNNGEIIYRDPDHLASTFVYNHPQFIGRTLKLTSN